MNIQNLKCFLVTTETLNFTKTGEQLFLSQQGVSRVINSLEKELDVPLFVRSKHALSLTPYGAAFKETASEILKQYDYFLERVEELKEEKRAGTSADYKKLGSGIFMSLVIYLLGDILGKLPGTSVIAGLAWSIIIAIVIKCTGILSDDIADNCVYSMNFALKPSCLCWLQELASIP